MSAARQALRASPQKKVQQPVPLAHEDACGGRDPFCPVSMDTNSTCSLALTRLLANVTVSGSAGVGRVWLRLCVQVVITVALLPRCHPPAQRCVFVLHRPGLLGDRRAPSQHVCDTLGIYNTVSSLRRCKPRAGPILFAESSRHQANPPQEGSSVVLTGWSKVRLFEKHQLLLVFNPVIGKL